MQRLILIGDSIRQDGVHMTDLGNDVLARAVVAAVRRTPAEEEGAQA